MNKILLSILCVVVMATASVAQTEIIRKPLDYPNLNFFSSRGWADDHEYMLINFQYASGFNAFRLLHRKRGEISAYAGEVGIDKVFGFTSTDTEFTLYFKGRLPMDIKKDYFFLTFFKDGSRAPVLTNWMDKAVQDDNLLSYSAFNKLYVLKGEKEILQLVEVTNYQKSRVISFIAFKDLKKILSKIDNYKTVLSQSNAVSTMDESVVVYPFKDSVILITNRSNRYVDGENFTQLIKFDFNNSKINIRKVSSNFKAHVNSVIMKDRLYQLSFGDNLMRLAIYHYPSLKKLKEFSYREGEEVQIKTSPLVSESGKNLEEKWNDEKKNKKIANELLKGVPYLSGQIDSTTTTLQMGSQIWMPVATPSGSYSKYYFVHFNVCIDHDQVPCTSQREEFVYDQAIESFRRLKDKDKSDKVTMIENDAYVYTIHFIEKAKEYFIEEFKK